MLNNYFKLQYRIISRSFEEFGFNKYLLVPVILAFYISLFYFISLSPSWGVYLVSLLNFQWLFALSGFNRNEFLRNTFETKDFHFIRLLENFTVSIGTIIVITISDNYLLVGILLALCVLFVFISTNSIWSNRIPTPFTRKPFEFIIGFRSTWLLIVLLYSIAVIGLVYNNQNLALVSMFVICLCSAFYYQEPEPYMIFWNQDRKPVEFIWYKIKRGIIQLSILLIPLVILQILFFPSELYKPILVWGLGILLIPFTISLKYAAYPEKVGISEGIILALCLAFYPLILAIIPYYYFKAIANLKKIS
ncbi:hypothetical protein [Sphingobacterium daejeonense]|uniref:hypothetical protein n=1 Tax=Sphingobacterium daejeonense TaxID=371142 RepID=UPI0010C30BB6|nr:hypothetical protein [Sphingobacterium daejeonense]VTQ04800.1 Uncharacterised protein [Sphingobacterium daejeonense]